MHLPLVSVLICAYNTEKYIEQCINSVINQTYTNLEIVIVNDGSTDNTKHIIEKLANQDNRISIINNEMNIGYISSLNKGIQHIKGEYIAKIDSDDVAKPDWIKNILEKMLEDPTIIAMGCYLEIISVNGKLGKYYKTGDIWKNALTDAHIKNDMLFYNPIHNNTMIMKSLIHKKYGLIYDLNYIHAEDYKFWFEVSKLGKMANYPEALVYYRLHSEQTSSNHNASQINTAKKIRREIITYYMENLGFVNIIDFDNIKFSVLNKLLLEKDVWNRLTYKDIENLKKILFDCFMSAKVDSYTICRTIFTSNAKCFTFKQKVKIIKKMLRPYKYIS
ncbi:glycosyltransferase, partial [Glaesserella parasuis]|nr:glycosyltransferase [Glaesserella parasuis]